MTATINTIAAAWYAVPPVPLEDPEVSRTTGTLI